MDNKNIYSRREALGGIGAGLASLVVAPSFAGIGATSAVSVTGIEDPIKKYPAPPFKEQKQPWPGLASRMDPKPDHGETSYKGSNRLSGRKALITGGDSG